MYDSGEVLSIVGSIGVLITALGAVIVNIIVAMRTGKKLDDSLVNQKTMSHQIQEVHTITNSNLSLITAQRDKALAQVEEMRASVRDLKGERDKLATVTALNTPVPAGAASAPTEIFKAIEKNTENIDINTKKLISDDKKQEKK